MALTPAEKQRRYRGRQSARMRSHSDVVEQELLQDVERAQRGELSTQQRAALADQLSNIATHHLWRAKELAEIARKVRPPVRTPPGSPGR
jgi:hypothetical protein